MLSAAQAHARRAREGGARPPATIGHCGAPPRSGNPQTCEPGCQHQAPPRPPAADGARRGGGEDARADAHTRSRRGPASTCLGGGLKGVARDRASRAGCGGLARHPQGGGGGCGGGRHGGLPVGGVAAALHHGGAVFCGVPAVQHGPSQHEHRHSLHGGAVLLGQRVHGHRAVVLLLGLPHDPGSGWASCGSSWRQEGSWFRCGLVVGRHGAHASGGVVGPPHPARRACMHGHRRRRGHAGDELDVVSMGTGSGKVAQLGAGVQRHVHWLHHGPRALPGPHPRLRLAERVLDLWELGHGVVRVLADVRGVLAHGGHQDIGS
mmetsp:Transcript_28614/g.54722  ORF Transcript_28614/g.54722 Transcript_28614/m.54722 type:complete len:321 (-) Transcript_28614:1399-2361(-)